MTRGCPREAGCSRPRLGGVQWITADERADASRDELTSLLVLVLFKRRSSPTPEAPLTFTQIRSCRDIATPLGRFLVEALGRCAAGRSLTPRLPFNFGEDVRWTGPEAAMDRLATSQSVALVWYCARESKFLLARQHQQRRPHPSPAYSSWSRAFRARAARRE